MVTCEICNFSNNRQFEENINEIHDEMIETEIVKYRQQAASKKADADFFRNKRKCDRKPSNAKF